MVSAHQPSAEYEMPECPHKNLVLIKEPANKLRCKTCHLTITADELGDSYCPECYESTGKKRLDFEKVAAPSSDISKYRCEDCGVMIETT